MTRNKSIILTLAGALCVQLAPLRGENVGSVAEWFEHQAERAWLESYDSTIFTRRLLTQFEYEDNHGDSENAKWLWNLRWAFPIQKDLAFGAQLELPLRWANESGDQDLGFGAIESRVGVAGRIAPEMRWGLSLNMKFPTASSEELGQGLGDGVFELRPIAGVRWEMANWIEVGVNVEYGFTPRDEGDDSVSYLDLKFPVVLKLADNLSALVSYNQRWNYAKDSGRHRLELGLTRSLGSGNKYAISAGAEIPMTTENLNWKATLGLTRYLR